MTLSRTGTFATSLAPLVCSVTAAALPAVTSGPAPGSSHEFVELAPGVYATIRHVDIGTVDGNTLFIINDSDVVVVDTGVYQTDARQVIAEIRKRTDKPVRYIINTHDHGDHTIGNKVFLEAFPGAEVIGQAKSRELALADGPLDTGYRKELAAIDQKLALGKTADGPLTPEHRKRLEISKADFEFWLKDNADARRIAPTMTLTDELVLQRGARVIELKFFGAGHTAGDLVVYLPHERILATGDLVVQPVPFGGATHFHEWAATLRALKTLDVAVIIPGHGDIQRDWKYVDREIALLDATWYQVSSAVNSGANLDATRKAVNGDVLSKDFGITAPKDRDEFDYLYLDAAVEAAFNEASPH